MLIEALKLKLKSIKKDDDSINKEGLDALNAAELLDAAHLRGLQLHAGASEAETKNRSYAYLQDWLEFSKAKVPMFVHGLARSQESFSDPFCLHSSYLHLLLRSLDADGVLSNANSPKVEAVITDEKKTLLPDLVEISLVNASHQNLKSADSTSEQLQSKIESMLHELEATVGVSVQTDVSAEVATTPAGLTPAALICAKTVFASFDSNGDRILPPNPHPTPRSCIFSPLLCFFLSIQKISLAMSSSNQWPSWDCRSPKLRSMRLCASLTPTLPGACLSRSLLTLWLLSIPENL
jgi:hypothetical protein